MNRTCPNCSKRSIAVTALVLSRSICPTCGAIVGVKRVYAVLFLIVTFGLAAARFVAILAQQGLYAALIFLPLPVGAVGYIKARFSPLQVRTGMLGPVVPPSQDKLS